MKISSAGIPTVVAGNGFHGTSGDNGPAIKAELMGIQGLAVHSGYLYIVTNFQIRRVNLSTGIITTVAGAEPHVSCSVLDEENALEAEISPEAITFEAGGKLYFINGCGDSIEKIESGNIHFVANVTYETAGSIAFNSEGELVVTSDNGVSTVTPGGEVSTLAGYPESFTSGFSGDGGPATSAKFENPEAVALDEAGNVLVADTGNYRIREILASNGKIHTIAGQHTSSEPNGDFGPAIKAFLNAPHDLAVDSNGNLDIGTDFYDGPLRQIRADGAPLSSESTIVSLVAAQSNRGETNGGCNPSEDACCAHSCHGDPVDTATGEYWQRKQDLAIPARGLPINFTRTYSSQAAQEQTEPGLMGYGWSDSYGMSLTTDEVTGDITIHQENGSTVLFVPNAAGTAYVSETRVLATLVKNESGTWTFTRRARQKFIFNAAGQLIEEKDLNGETTTLGYTEGQLNSVTDPAGRKLTLAYNKAGEIESIADPAKREVKYSYEKGDLTSVTDVGGGTWKYTYENHLLLTEEDPRENIILTNTYDGANRVETQKEGLNRETTFAYDGDGTLVTSPEGNETRYEYASGLLREKIEGLGTEDEATWKYAYDPITLGVTSVTDPNGNTTTMTYDSAGNLMSKTDPLEHTTSYSYDELNDRETVTDAKNVTTTFKYDEDGNLTSASTPYYYESPYEQKWSFGHEDGSHPGDVTAIADPVGNTSKFGYDKYGDLTSSTDEEGDKTTYTYNGIGQRTSMVSPLGNVKEATASDHETTYEPDVFGDVTKTVDPLKGETDLEYDGDRNLISVTDPDENTTGYVYDKANQLIEIKRADTTVLKNGYDEDGNLKSQTDAAGKATSYTHDPLDRIASVADPLERTTHYVHDGAGNLIEMIDPESRTTTYGYDEANLLRTINYSSEGTPDASFEYDKDNQPKSMSDGTGSSSFVYDELHRLTEATQQGITVGFGYDLANNETSITYPGSNEVIRKFDKANRLESVTDWSERETGFKYDADSDLTSITFPSGTTNVDSYGYDHADRLTSVAMKKGEATTASLAYKRDPMGQLEKEEQSGLPGAASTSFGYNLLNQLSSAGASNYSYSSADNVTNLAGANGYEYDNANELKTIPSGAPGGAATLSYDELGERTELNPETGPTIEYGYDQAGRLTGAGIESYAYGGDGLRLSTTVEEATKHFSWDRNGGIPLLLSDGSTSYIYGPGGLPIEQIAEGGTPTYYHHDQLGSTRMLTNSSGTIKGTFSYAPYGKLAGSTGEQTTPLSYAGEYTDPVSGLQYLRARYYDPATGQFISRDPLAALTRSAYGYVDNNPLNGTDPTGLFFGEGFLGGLTDPFNPLKYYEEEIDAVEIGCSYGESVLHGLQGASMAFLDGTGAGEVMGLARGAAGGAVAGEESRALRQTAHGAERALDPSRLSAVEARNVIANATQTFTQSDGAQAFVQSVGGGRYNVVIQGQNGIVTNLKTISQPALDRLASNYGWTPQ